MFLTVVEVEEEAAHIFVVDLSSAIGFVLRNDLNTYTYIRNRKVHCSVPFRSGYVQINQVLILFFLKQSRTEVIFLSFSKNKSSKNT